MSDATAMAETEFAKRKWIAPHIIEAEVATRSEYRPFPGVDVYESVFTGFGSS